MVGGALALPSAGHRDLPGSHIIDTRGVDPRRVVGCLGVVYDASQQAVYYCCYSVAQLSVEASTLRRVLTAGASSLRRVAAALANTV